MEILGNLFLPSHRATGMSLSLTVPPALLGGVTPLILTYMIHITGSLSLPAFYLEMFALLALFASLSLKLHQTK